MKRTEHVSVVSTKTPKVNVTVTEKQCKFLLDTGATVSLIDQKTHDRIGAPKLTRYFHCIPLICVVVGIVWYEPYSQSRVP
jgi:predicted aspartyl protease